MGEIHGMKPDVGGQKFCLGGLGGKPLMGFGSRAIDLVASIDPMVSARFAR